MKVYIGTSGWSYDHWKGDFYPTRLPKSKWLPYLANIFNTVEINATFYRQPKPETFKKWYSQTPEPFRFSLKVNRFITHIKKLRDIEASLTLFYKGISTLNEKIGALLFQLPPSLRFDPENTKRFLNCINPIFHTAIEARNPSFFNEDFYKLLQSYHCALCWSDTANHYPYKEIVTADFLYIRLHGSPILYRSAYSNTFLSAMGEKILSAHMDTFIYFDNDAEGHAPKNALWLKRYLETRMRGDETSI